MVHGFHNKLLVYWRVNHTIESPFGIGFNKSPIDAILKKTSGLLLPDGYEKRSELENHHVL